MNYLSLILIAILFNSCAKKSARQDEISTKADAVIDTTSITSKTKIETESDTLNEVMLEGDVIFNDKVSRLFRLTDFDNIFGKPDSTKLMSEEEPCSYYFQNDDGSKDMEDKYLYKNGSRYENNKDRVVVDEFWFVKGNFMMYKGKRIDSGTTIDDLRKIFPNAIRNIGTLNEYRHGNLQYIWLREDATGISDGHIRIFFRENRIYFMHWWFPC